MTSLEDLRAEWALRDARLEQTLRLNVALAKETMIDKARERVRRKGQMRHLGLAVWIAFVAAFAAFTIAHIGEWKFFVPGAALYAWVLIVGILTIIQREALNAVDFAASPLAVQKRLAQLTLDRVRMEKWAFLTGQVLWWIPFFIVLFKGLFGVDLYTLSDFASAFIVWNVAIGIAVIPVLIGLSALIAKLIGPARTRSLLDSFAGRDMAEARALADRLARFEAES